MNDWIFKWIFLSIVSFGNMFVSWKEWLIFKCVWFEIDSFVIFCFLKYILFVVGEICLFSKLNNVVFFVLFGLIIEMSFFFWIVKFIFLIIWCLLKDILRFFVFSKCVMKFFFLKLWVWKKYV